jgi:hypothetical protein
MKSRSVIHHPSFNGDVFSTVEAEIENLRAANALTAVSADSTFANDNRLLRSDGTARKAQASTVVVDDTGNMSGVVNLTATGNAQIDGNATLGNAAADSVLMNGKSVTKPNAPAFLAHLNAGATNVTGDGTAYAVVFDTELFDTGSDFASNAFTAPVTGKYHLAGAINITGMLAGHTTAILEVVTSNRRYRVAQSNPQASKDVANDAFLMHFSIIVDMTATHTATVELTVTGGTKVIDIAANITQGTYFSGALIG